MENDATKTDGDNEGLGQTDDRVGGWNFMLPQDLDEQFDVFVDILHVAKQYLLEQAAQQYLDHILTDEQVQQRMLGRLLVIQAKERNAVPEEPAAIKIMSGTTFYCMNCNEPIFPEDQDVSIWYHFTSRSKFCFPGARSGRDVVAWPKSPYTNA